DAPDRPRPTFSARPGHRRAPGKGVILPGMRGRWVGVPLVVAAALVCRDASARAGDPQLRGRIPRVESGLLPAVGIRGEPSPAKTVADRMAFYKVPGLSVALIDGGEVSWARGYGMTERGGTRAVTEDTLFQTASIGKALSAFVALRLVD